MFVADYMTHHPVVIDAHDSLAQAEQSMREHHVRHLPVLDNSKRLVGLLSDRDARAAIGYDRRLGAELTVAEVMTHDPEVLPVAATLDEALAVFCTTRYGALPVVRGPALVGILTRSDLLRAFSSLLGLDRPGRRVEVALPNGYADLAAAFQALSTCEREVLSAVVCGMRRDGAEPSLYLRVDEKMAQDAERRLRQAALIVLVPEHP